MYDLSVYSCRKKSTDTFNVMLKVLRFWALTFCLFPLLYSNIIPSYRTFYRTNFQRHFHLVILSFYDFGFEKLVKCFMHFSPFLIQVFSIEKNIL